MTTTFYQKSLSYQVMGAAFAVHGVLGNHFVEAVYQRALCLELQDRGFSVEMPGHSQARCSAMQPGKKVIPFIIKNVLWEIIVPILLPAIRLSSKLKSQS